MYNSLGILESDCCVTVVRPWMLMTVMPGVGIGVSPCNPSDLARPSSPIDTDRGMKLRSRVQPHALNSLNRVGEKLV